MAAHVNHMKLMCSTMGKKWDFDFYEICIIPTAK